MSVMSNIVGIDIGNDKCVVAIVKPKAIQILMNHDAKYEIPSVVSFTKKKRQIGTEKASLAMMNPENTITQVKRLIGQNFDEPGMAEELKLFPFKTSKADDGGILIHVNYLKQEWTFTPVQILAMLLCHLKQMIQQNDTDLPVSDCVISAPSYFNDLQRAAYLNAAEIAGLNLLRLMNDGTAIALGYGYFKRDLDSPINVVFVDVGHSDTQVTVAQFDREGVTILSHAFDRNLGGRDFDRVLYNHFLKDFSTRYKIDIESNPRATVRLMSACEKVKTVLTANKEANMSIDCLVNDIGVDGSIKGDEFDKLSTNLLKRLRTTLDTALTDAKLKNAQINCVELVGSGSRIPAMSNEVRGVFGMEPNRTLNGSDCVARGCAFQCSIMLSGSRGSKDYKVQDSIPFRVGLSSTSRLRKIPEDDENQNTRIPKTISFNVRRGSSSPSTKETTSSDVGDASFVSNPSGSHQISSILFEKGQLTSRKKIVEFSEASQEFKFSIFYLYKGDSTPSASQKPRTFTVDDIKMGSNNSIQVRVEISIDVHGMVVIAASASQLNPVKGKQEITVEKLKCNEMLPIGMSKDSITEAQESEKRLLRHDKYVDEVQGQKNDLESFIYSTRKEVNGRYEEYAKKTERERILKKLDALETWLSENDDPEDESVSCSKELNALRKLVNPIESRYKYFLDCTELTKDLHISIAELDGVLTSKKLAGYYNMYSHWVSAVEELQRLLPKDIEHLPVLLEKIRQMKKLTEESCRLTDSCKTSDDFHQTIERSASSFRDANNDSLSDCHGSEQKKNELLPFVQEICTRLSDLLQNTAPNSAGANETPNETIGSLLQKEQDNHLDNLGTSSSVPSKMLDLKQDELKDKPNPSSSELKREQEDIKPERTAEEKESINSKIFDIQLELSERYGDFVPRLEKEEIDKKLHEIKNCLHHLGDDEDFYQQIDELRKFLASFEEQYYTKEESTGQRRAQLLYMIFDSRVKIMCMASCKSDVAGNQEFIRLVERAKYVCDNVEKIFEEVKSQETLPCEKESENHLKRLQQEIQQFEDTVIEETKTEATLALQNSLLDIEKKVFGRYRYVAQSDEKKNISKIIKGTRHSLQRSEAGDLSSLWLKEKLQEMENVISTLEGRYEENKSKILDAAVELCDYIFELSRTAKSKRIPSIKKQCDDDLKWLDRNYQIPNITTISKIKKRKESLNAYCEDMLRSNLRMDSLERDDAGNQPIRILPRGLERIGRAIHLVNRRQTHLN